MVFALLTPTQADDNNKTEVTVMLVCSTGSSVEASSAIIDLNEAEGVVTIHHDAVKDSRGKISLNGSMDRLKRVLPRTTITFVAHLEGRRYDWTYTINRLTGIVDMMQTVEGHQYHDQMTCHVGNAQF